MKGISRKTKFIFLFIAAACLLVAATAWAVVLGSAGMLRADEAHPEKLLVDIRDLPDVPFIRVQSAAVKLNPLTEDFRTDYFGANGYAWRRWGVDHDNYLLVAYALSYSSERLANAEFAAAPYGRVFNDSIYLDYAHVVDLARENLKTDSAAMGCMGGYDNRLSHCLGWAFRGRYGNYLIEIVFMGARDSNPNRALDQDTFLQIVKRVDRHVANLHIA